MLKEILKQHLSVEQINYLKDSVKELYCFKMKIIKLFLFYLRRNKKTIEGINNYVEIGLSELQRVTVKVIGNNNRLVISDKCSFSDILVQIKGNNNTLYVGARSKFTSGWLTVQGDGRNLRVGDDFYCGGNTSIAAYDSDITIGDGCVFSSSTMVITTDSHPIFDLETGQRINYSKDVTIGDKVWIGRHARILKGVKIGSGSIVGINSVVTKDIPQNCTVAGNPAKIVREKVRWARE